MQINNLKVAVICFFTAYPSLSGSAKVCYDFFSCLKVKDKKLFQYSQKKTRNNRVVDIIIKNNPIYKVLYLPIFIYKVLKFFDNQKKKIIFIEGPSWAFYSFIFVLFFKCLKSDFLVIYRSHSIEYEIRKKNSSNFLSLLTFFFEKKILQLSDICTSVSVAEKQKFYNYYKVKTYLFPNSISYQHIKKINLKKIMLPKKFIFYCGSYKYKPNKQAIDIIINKILPKISNTGIKFVLAGGGFPKKDKKVINLDILKDSELKYVYKKALAIVAPIFEGYGTRIKFIEALLYNCRIISTKKGFEGLKKDKNVFLTNKINRMIIEIKNLKINKTNITNAVNLDYSMEENLSRFFKKYERKIYY